MAAKTSQEAREALRLLQQGATVQEAMKAGVCESTVWRLIKLHGIAYKRKKKDNLDNVDVTGPRLRGSGGQQGSTAPDGGDDGDLD